MSQVGLGAPLRSRARPSLPLSLPAQPRASSNIPLPRTRGAATPTASYGTITASEISQGGREVGSRARGRTGGLALPPSGVGSWVSVEWWCAGGCLEMSALGVPTFCDSTFTRRANRNSKRETPSPAQVSLVALAKGGGHDPWRAAAQTPRIWSLDFLVSSLLRTNATPVSLAKAGRRSGSRASARTRRSWSPELFFSLLLRARARSLRRANVGGHDPWRAAAQTPKISQCSRSPDLPVKKSRALGGPCGG